MKSKKDFNQLRDVKAAGHWGEGVNRRWVITKNKNVMT